MNRLEFLIKNTRALSLISEPTPEQIKTIILNYRELHSLALKLDALDQIIIGVYVRGLKGKELEKAIGISRRWIYKKLKCIYERFDNEKKL